MEQSTWVQNGSRLAVAAALILGAGIAFRLIGNQRPAGPGLPAPVIGDVRRGSDLELVEPIGDLETLPTQLVWKEWSGAASYRVSLRGVDPQPLWESTAKTVAISLPLELQQQMHRAVTYRWQVQALDNNQVTLGVSLEKTFSARPTARALESVPQGEETGKE